MGLLCWEDYTLQTALSPQEAALALDRFVGGSTGAFAGEVTERGFHIAPVARGRNSWRPQLRGGFHPLPGGGCTVTVRVRTHWFTRIFMAVWYALLTFGTLAMAAAALLEGWRWEMLSPALFWLWGWGLGYFGFHRPAARARAKLCVIWSAEA